MNFQATTKPLSLILLVSVASLQGCASTSTLPEALEITIAKKAVRTKWNWEEVEVKNSRFIDGRWIVNIWKLPKAPGGMATVEISPDGKVLHLYPGM